MIFTLLFFCIFDKIVKKINLESILISSPVFVMHNPSQRTHENLS